MRKLFAIILVVLVVGSALSAYKFFKESYHLWFFSYIKWELSSSPDNELIEKPQHVLFLIVDHFEPGGNYEYLKYWLKRYEQVASKHKDSDGVNLQRVFSYPIEQFDTMEVRMITDFCIKGYGDIELQLHHFNDTEQSLRIKFIQGINDLQNFGWALTEDSQTAFSFVHGNWALDDSRYVNGVSCCGVTSEIKMLSELGCYLDVTFPAIATSSQPSKINSIYYSTDDPREPKSYNNGINVEFDKENSGDLMHLQGPLLINWSDWRFKFHPTIESGDLYHGYPPYPKRADLWVRANVHVIGQPNWIFVKLHAHGSHQADSLAVWGDDFDRTLNYLEDKYNDGENYLLHYITTREAYNIIKAAEDGKTGNPNDFRNYFLKSYIAKKVKKSENKQDDSNLNNFSAKQN